LPFAAKGLLLDSDVEVAAAAVARQAIRELPEGASWEEMQFAARQAVDGVIKEFERNLVPRNALSKL